MSMCQEKICFNNKQFGPFHCFFNLQGKLAQKMQGLNSCHPAVVKQKLLLTNHIDLHE